MPDPTLNTLTNVVGQEFKRAGFGANPKDYALGMVFDAPYTLATTGDADVEPWAEFKNLLLSGDPDTKPADLSLLERGQRNQQLSEFKGRGWSNDELKAYEAKNGPLPPMLMSEGDQQADQWRANREFIDRHLQLQDVRDKHPNLNNRIDVLQHDNAQQRDAKEGREYGQSGWAGALQNPEYTAGWLMNNLMDPGYTAYSYTAHQGTGKDRGGAYQSLVNDPATYRDIKNAANKVSPILPGDPKTPAEKEEKYAQLQDLKNAADPRYRTNATSYDAYYREKYGEYPSYAGSSLHEFLQNLIDPTIVAGAAGAARGGFSALGKSLIQEGLEEIPMAAGIMGGITAYQDYKQSFLPKHEQKRVNLSEMFTPGVRDELPDQSQDEFLKWKKAEDAKRVNALSTAPDVLKQVPGAVHKPSGTPYGYMMPRMPIAR
jgi:hypothetical protein